MSRSLKKGPFVEVKLLEKIEKMNDGSSKRPPGRARTLAEIEALVLRMMLSSECFTLNC